MSQEKVARYKEQKANRKQIMKQEKRARLIRNTVALVVCVAVVGWVGYSGVTKWIDSIPRDAVEVDYTEVNNYLNGLHAE